MAHPATSQAGVSDHWNTAEWPTHCPRCEVSIQAGGWDPPTNQCRTCWQLEEEVETSMATRDHEARETRRAGPAPSDAWCKATTSIGERCLRDAEKDGYCRIHWRKNHEHTSRIP